MLACVSLSTFASQSQHVFVRPQRAQAALRAVSTSHVDTSLVAPSSVLRVVVENLVYPVSLDALCQVTQHVTNTPVP